MCIYLYTSLNEYNEWYSFQQSYLEKLMDYELMIHLTTTYHGTSTYN